MALHEKLSEKWFEQVVRGTLQSRIRLVYRMQNGPSNPDTTGRWATLQRLRDNTQCTEKSRLTSIVQILLEAAMGGKVFLSNAESTVTYDD